MGIFSLAGSVGGSLGGAALGAMGGLAKVGVSATAHTAQFGTQAALVMTSHVSNAVGDAVVQLDGNNNSIFGAIGGNLKSLSVLTGAAAENVKNTSFSAGITNAVSAISAPSYGELLANYGFKGFSMGGKEAAPAFTTNGPTMTLGTHSADNVCKYDHNPADDFEVPAAARQMSRPQSGNLALAGL